MKLCLYNTYSNNVCAYCYFHKCYITPHQLTAKECLQKKCDCIKKEEHEIWAQKARKNQKRKARKERINAIVSQYGGK